jgi:hypothetical protein
MVVTTAPAVKTFLLIQRGKIVDINENPTKLRFHKLFEFWDFQIYAGCLNEWGYKEIAGPICKVWVAKEFSKYTFETTCALYTNSGSFTATTTPDSIIYNELKRLMKDGQLSDPCNLGTIKLFAC